jgi:hemerythrin
MAGKYIKWLDEYNLGIPDIDQQHQSVFDLIDELNEAFVNRETDLKMKYLLAELEKYAENHFKTEEKHFKAAKYSEMTEHFKSHELYRDKIKEFRKKHDMGSNVTYTLMSFLRLWWTQHILKEDKAYASVLKEYIKVHTD